MSIKCLPKKIVTNAGNVGAAIAAGAVLLIMLFIVIEVISRYVFNRPTFWSMESNEYLLVISVWGAIGYTQRYRGHIRVDMLFQRYPERLAAIAELFFFIVSLGICAIVIWQGVVVSSSWFASDTRSNSIMRFPITFIFVFIPFGFFLYALQLLDDIWKCISILRGVGDRKVSNERMIIERE